MDNLGSAVLNHEWTRMDTNEGAFLCCGLRRVAADESQGREKAVGMKLGVLFWWLGVVVGESVRI